MPLPSEFLSPTSVFDLSYGEAKQDKAIRSRAIRTADLSEASRFIAQDSADAGWYCLEIRSGRERAVHHAMEDEKILSLMPVRKGKDIHRRGRVIAAPLMPVMIGYLLVRVVPKVEAFRGLRGMDDVTGIVGGMLRPFRIPDREVFSFNHKAQEGAFDYRKIVVHFDVGERVLITDGPFAGFPGTVVGIDNLKCGLIDIETKLFGRLTPVKLVVAQVEKV